MAKLVWIAGLFLCMLQGVSQRATFHTYQPENGLSHSHIQCITEDSLGFLWIGTLDGLNRFDGSNFTVFRKEHGNENSLINNEVKAMCWSPSHKLWIGTRLGLSCYDPVTNEFTNYLNQNVSNFEAQNYVHALWCDEFENVWFGTYDGLFKLHNDEITQVIHADADVPGKSLIWTIWEDDEHNLWLGSQNGLRILKRDEYGQIMDTLHYMPESGNPRSLPSIQIWEFDQDDAGHVWIGSDWGISRAEGNLDSLSFTRITRRQEIPNNLSYDYVSDFEIADNFLRIGTYSGGLNALNLNTFDGSDAHFSIYRSNTEDPTTLSGNEVNVVFTSSQGITWCGTEAGLSKMIQTSEQVATYRHIPNIPTSISNNHVTAVLRDSKGRLWVGSRGDGVSVSDPNAMEFDHFTSSDEGGLLHNDVYHIYEDSANYIWILSYHGLNYCHVDEIGPNNWKSIEYEDGLAHRYCVHLFEDQPGKYWLATYGGLNRMTFDPSLDDKPGFVTYASDHTNPRAYVNSCSYSVAQDANGDMWFGTFDGLCRFVPPSANDTAWFDNYKLELRNEFGLKNNKVHCLFADSGGRLWAGTSDGLHFVDISHERARLTRFGTEHGLPNSFVQSIEEDRHGNLWLSTNGGLVCIDPVKAIEQGSEFVQGHYNHLDGMQGLQFSPRTSAKDNEGNLYFGGIHGLNVFDPLKLNDIEGETRPIFTGLQIFNRTIECGDTLNDRILLSSTLPFTNRLSLRWYEHSLRLEVSSRNFMQPEKNLISWQMAGDMEWQDSQTGVVSYTNLAPGDYTLLVKSRNPDGSWSDPTSMDISIQAPPWLSWWAYLIYGALIIGSLWLIIYTRTRKRVRRVEEHLRIERARQEEREQLREKTAADFHDELGHRLTKIALYSELVERTREEAPKQSEYLSKLRDNTTGLADGIRDFIWAFDPGKDTLYQMMMRLQEFGIELFENMEVAFHMSGLSGDLDSIAVNAEKRRNVVLILKEVMNNAAKHSGCTRFDLKIDVGESITITAKDNGKGFDTTLLASSGNGLRNMHQRAEKNQIDLKLNTESGTEAVIEFKT